MYSCSLELYLWNYLRFTFHVSSSREDGFCFCQIFRDQSTCDQFKIILSLRLFNSQEQEEFRPQTWISTTPGLPFLRNFLYHLFNQFQDLKKKKKILYRLLIRVSLFLDLLLIDDITIQVPSCMWGSLRIPPWAPLTLSLRGCQNRSDSRGLQMPQEKSVLGGLLTSVFLFLLIFGF